MEMFEHGGVETINLLCGDVSFMQLYSSSTYFS